MNKIEVGIVDSFVFNTIKNQGTKGAGESKLHLTSKQNESSYDNFFNKVERNRDEKKKSFIFNITTYFEFPVCFM